MDVRHHTVQEEPQNVEAWVVRAISEGVIDGRIDQLNRKAMGNRACSRLFLEFYWLFTCRSPILDYFWHDS